MIVALFAASTLVTSLLCDLSALGDAKIGKITHEADPDIGEE